MGGGGGKVEIGLLFFNTMALGGGGAKFEMSEISHKNACSEFRY